jgi:hypothetical protein
MYYVMRFDRGFPRPAMIMPAPQIPGFTNPVFDKGVRIKQPVPVFDLVIDDKGQGTLTDYLWVTLRGLTLSVRFKATLDAVGVDNVDYYPVRIVNAVTKEVRTDYFEANLVGVIDCLDREASEVERSPMNPLLVRAISRMVLDETAISGELLFRLEDVKGIVLAHKKVKTAVEKAKLTGVVFIPVKEFTWP